MPVHRYRATQCSGLVDHFAIHLTFEDDHWAATCERVDESGLPLPGAPATPKFYGITAEQAHRRMLSVLEDRYEEIVSDVEDQSA